MTERLRKVAPLVVAGLTPKKPDTGMPIVEMVAPADLWLDFGYQRDHGERSARHIRRIVESFSWGSYKMPICAFAEVEGVGTVLKVIDGGHTVTAAASNPHIDKIPVMIIEAPETKLQAHAFISHNTDRLAVSATQLHHAAVTAGDEDALTVEQVCARAGVHILRGPPGRAFHAGETVAISSIKALVSRRGAKRAREILEALVKSGRAPLTANDIKAGELLLTDPDYAGEMDLEVLAAAIVSAGPAAEQDAKLFAAAHRVPFWKALAVTWFKKKGRARKAEAA